MHKRFPLLSAFAIFGLGWFLLVWLFIFLGHTLTGELHNPISLGGLWVAPVLSLIIAVLCYRNFTR